jgi:hypothetical protein
VRGALDADAIDPFIIKNKFADEGTPSNFFVSNITFFAK